VRLALRVAVTACAREFAEHFATRFVAFVTRSNICLKNALFDASNRLAGLKLVL
jgi:hypothetical protein